MTKIATVLLMLARLLGVVQLLVGLAIWFHIATTAVAMHIGLGMLFVLVLWALALFGLFALPARGVPLLTLLVGALVGWFGVAQRTMMMGSAHWTVQVIHLVLGVAALGLAERLGKAVRANEAAKRAVV